VLVPVRLASFGHSRRYNMQVLDSHGQRLPGTLILMLVVAVAHGLLCWSEEPQFREIGARHSVACHHGEVDP